MAENKKPQPKKDKKTDQEKKEADNNQGIVKAESSEVQKPADAKSDDLIGEVIPAEAMANMPPEVRQSLQAYFAMISKTTSGPRPNPLFEKFTEAHVDKYLDMVKNDDDHEYKMATSNRWFYLTYAGIALGAFIFSVIYLLPKDRDLLIQLITIIVILGGGIGAGYGLSRRD